MLNTWIRRLATTVCCGLLWLNGSLAAAQGPSNAGKWQAGLGGLAAVAVGEFSTDVDLAGGLALYVNRALGQSVFSLGGEIGWMEYGSTSRLVFLGGLIPEVPDASVEVTTSNDMMLVHGRLRAQRRQGRWRPYGDGQVGVTELSTRTAVQGSFECTTISDGFGGVSADCNRSTSSEATQARDFVLSYGASGGVMMRFGSSPAWLDLSVRYHRGGEALYLTRGAVRVVGDRAFLDFSRSRTDMVVFYVGVAYGR